jgi:2-phosphoglycerate kinase
VERFAKWVMMPDEKDHRIYHRYRLESQCDEPGALQMRFVYDQKLTFEEIMEAARKFGVDC